MAQFCHSQIFIRTDQNLCEIHTQHTVTLVVVKDTKYLNCGFEFSYKLKLIDEIKTLDMYINDDTFKLLDRLFHGEITII